MGLILLVLGFVRLTPGFLVITYIAALRALTVLITTSGPLKSFIVIVSLLRTCFLIANIYPSQQRGMLSVRGAAVSRHIHNADAACISMHLVMRVGN
jgi:hypothetical protein